jgi:multidrug efflux pump subunit AcrB
MWIVRLALRRPYTFVVASLLAALVGLLTIRSMPTDIFPQINIPVVSVIFRYDGLSPDDMEQRVTTQFERFLTTTVNDIEHTESQSLNGIAVIKIYFQPGAKIEAGIAQVTAVGQTAIKQMPPGMLPPLILQYDASSVPVLQLSLSSDVIPEQQLFDLAVNFLRPQLVTIPGVQIPYPYGGRQRQVMVDLDSERLQGFGLTAADVSSAIGAQNLILPGGPAKIGNQEYQVMINGSPPSVEALNNLPIKTVNGATVFIHDVAHVRDGYIPQINVVNKEGKRSVLLTILKLGSASTLDVVESVKAKLPQIRDTLPPELKISLFLDQSVFVRASVEGVVKEALIAAGLTALMILLFLGSWRSTLIVVISIPLSILVSIIVLGALGQTLNVMTLGGMALAVGILVDDATVEIENIHRNLHQRKRLVTAILDGASQIAVPAFVATLCICIVFVPVVFISGTAKFLFTPLAMAVVFAVATSYLLSRTLVPTMVHYLLAPEVEKYGGVLDESDPHAAAALRHKAEAGTGQDHVSSKRLGTLGRIVLLLVAASATVTAVSYWHWITAHWRLLAEVGLGLCAVVILARLIILVHEPFNSAFRWAERFYGGLLDWALEHRVLTAGAFTLVTAGSCLLFPLVGQDFFPSVDSGQIRLHVRCQPGTRLEETEIRFADVEQVIRSVIPDREIATVIDNMGIPNSGINLSLSDGTLMSPADGEILISMNPDHGPTPAYLRRLRTELAQHFPDLIFFFEPSDIVTQVLNFGLSAPIDIQITGPARNTDRNLELGRLLQSDLVAVPGIVDVHMHQVPETPDLRVNVDRVMANQMGLSERDVASEVLISLSSSNQTSPSFWLNPKSGVNYGIYVQTPERDVGSIRELEGIPIYPPPASPAAGKPQLLSNLAKIDHGSSATNVTHYNIMRTTDILMGVQGTDLGTAADRINALVQRYRDKLPTGSTIVLRGQIESLHTSFSGLAYGLIFAVLLVYLIMVINFQSWLDPLIILMALPGAFAGILWMLWATHTTLSVPALMGSIMSIGVATANSILMITFANDQRKIGMNAHDAALSAGLTRLRPVIMTALAMIIGMLPMALGLGEGGEQNAPLGRAVIGGLGFATFATLFFVPVVYSLLRRHAPITQVEKELMS